MPVMTFSHLHDEEPSPLLCLSYFTRMPNITSTYCNLGHLYSCFVIPLTPNFPLLSFSTFSSLPQFLPTSWMHQPLSLPSPHLLQYITLTYISASSYHSQIWKHPSVSPPQPHSSPNPSFSLNTSALYLLLSSVPPPSSYSSLPHFASSSYHSQICTHLPPFLPLLCFSHVSPCFNFFPQLNASGKCPSPWPLPSPPSSLPAHQPTAVYTILHLCIIISLTHLCTSTLPFFPLHQSHPVSIPSYNLYTSPHPSPPLPPSLSNELTGVCTILHRCFLISLTYLYTSTESKRCALSNMESIQIYAPVRPTPALQLNKRI